jgi:hypothetical protein
MRRYIAHDLEIGGTLSLAHQVKTYLAIVDVESYTPLDIEKADYLDLLSHMCGQTQALNAVIWETPSDTLNLKIQFTDNGRLSNELTRTHRLVFDGSVRTTTGKLCLTDDEQLLATSHRRNHDLLRGKITSEARCPHVLNVSPGIINVGVFCRRSGITDVPELNNDKVDYTILMRHYPLPPPRVAPIRLTGGLIPWAGEEAASRAWGSGHGPKLGSLGEGSVARLS